MPQGQEPRARGRHWEESAWGGGGLGPRAAPPSWLRAMGHGPSNTFIIVPYLSLGLYHMDIIVFSAQQMASILVHIEWDQYQLVHIKKPRKELKRYKTLDIN